MLPHIASAVGSDIEVLFDSGIRTGHDIVRALALGAKSCLIGRAYIYGLQAGGEAGVSRAIEILANEMKVAMGLAGVRSVKAIDRSILVD
jgi:L-lactate dehydrogenase (cytochrome)